MVKRQNNYVIFLFCLSLVCFVSVILFYICARVFSVSLPSFLVSFGQGFNVVSSLTFSTAPGIEGRPVHFYLYIILVVSIILAFLLGRAYPLPKKVFFISYFVFLVVFSLQTYFYLASFLKKDIFLPFISSQKKKQILFGAPFAFAQACKANAPAARSAKLITDIDITSSQGATIHRQLAYFLYPIDIRVRPRYTPIDTYVLFYKKNALAHVPQGYQVVFQKGTRFVLAVKRKDGAP